MAQNETHVCEQCGKRQYRGSQNSVKVFGSVFYFCCIKCENFWIDSRSRHFAPPEKVEYANPLNR